MKLEYPISKRLFDMQGATSTHENHPFDLEERTAQFGEAVIRFCKNVQLTPITSTLVDQLVRAATSIGANYCEANDSESKRDFRHRISHSRKESRESKHWLRMLVAAVPELAPDARKLWQEAKELNLIFSSIIRRHKQ